MNLSKSLYQAIELPKEVQLYTFRRVHQKRIENQTKNAQLDYSLESCSHGAMIEVFFNGHYAYAATSDLSPSSIQQTAVQAYELAKASEKYKCFSFSKKVRPSYQGMYKSVVEKTLAQWPLHEQFDFLKQNCEWLKVSSKIKTTQSLLFIDEIEQEILNSSGAHIIQNFNLFSFHCEATAHHSGETQRRTFHGNFAQCLQGGLELFLSGKGKDRIQLIGEQACELLHADQCPEKTTDLLLMPDQMLLQIHESIGHPLELDRILGDEKNYAGHSFVKPTDFGKLHYGSPLLNITFDPEPKQEYASYAYDESGVPAQKEYLIKKGVLLRGLGSAESGERLGLPIVANSRAHNWNRPLIDRMANINLEPGADSLENMIQETEEGVLMEANRSWSIDDERVKFQFGCEYAKEIKNGKIIRTLKNPNYQGKSIDFWKSLKRVGDKNTLQFFGSPYCGKGEPNQIIRVGHASPACLFNSIEIFGG
jgi:predicted Zn-dependent protease